MVRFKLVRGELALQRTDVFHVDVGGHRGSSDSGGLFERRITVRAVQSSEQVSNDTRTNVSRAAQRADASSRSTGTQEGLVPLRSFGG